MLSGARKWRMDKLLDEMHWRLFVWEHSWLTQIAVLFAWTVLLLLIIRL